MLQLALAVAGLTCHALFGKQWITSCRGREETNRNVHLCINSETLPFDQKTLCCNNGSNQTLYLYKAIFDPVESVQLINTCDIVKDHFQTKVDFDFAVEEHLTVNNSYSMNESISFNLFSIVFNDRYQSYNLRVGAGRTIKIQSSFFQYSFLLNKPPITSSYFNSTCLVFSSILSGIPAYARVVHVEPTSSFHATTTCGYRFTVYQTPLYFAQLLSSHHYFCLEDILALFPSSDLLLHVEEEHSHFARALQLIHLLPMHISSITLQSLPSKPSDYSQSTTIADRKQIVQYVHHPIAIFSEGETFVLLFIHPHELTLAQHQVDLWRKSCLLPTCQLTMTYRIYTLPPSLPANQALFVLSEVKQFLRDFATTRDVIYILHGLQAVAQFPQPAVAYAKDMLSCSSNLTEGVEVRGIIPAQTYGGPAEYYCLPSAIILASINKNQSEGLGAIVGVANELELFISIIQEKYLASDTVVEALVEEIVEEVVTLNNKWLSIDNQHHIFHPQTNSTHATSNTISNVTLDEKNEDVIFKSLLSYFPSVATHNIQGELLILLSSQNSASILQYIDFELYELLTSFYQQSIENVSCKPSYLLNLQTFIATLDDHYFTPNKWFSFLLSILHIFKMTKLKCAQHVTESVEHFVSMRLVAMGTGVFKILNLIDVHELEAAYSLLKAFLASYDSNDMIGTCGNDDSVVEEQKVLRNAIQTCLAGLSSQFQSVQQTRHLYYDLLEMDSHDTVKNTRQAWKEKRRVLLANFLRGQASESQADTHESSDDTSGNNKSKHQPRMIYLTYASSMTEGLENLLFTAQLAGIHINILGLDTPYEGIISKITAIDTFFKQYLHQAVQADDIVLIIDAYDVLVFPKIRRLHEQFLRDSETPIVFCAEAGRHPEAIAGYSYPHPYISDPDPDQNLNHPDINLDYPDPNLETENLGADSNSYRKKGVHHVKFLNGGCLLGRVGDITTLFTDAMKTAEVYQDDQMIFTRMYMQNPARVSLDVEEQFFMTGFKQASRIAREMRLSPAMEFYHHHRDGKDDDQVSSNKGKRSVALFHANNLRSNYLYASILLALEDFHNRASSSTLSASSYETFLKALWCVSDGYYDLARELLLSIGKAIQEDNAGMKLLKYVEEEKLHFLQKEPGKIANNFDDGEF